MDRHLLRPVFALMGIVALGAALSFATLACSCAQPAEPLDALAEADAVFAGRVVALRLEPQSPTDPALSFVPEDLLATFVVSSVWKGELSEETLVRTAFTCCVCGYGFQIGETYLVYAFADDSGLHTSACTRTKPTALARDDLVALGPGQPVQID